MVIPSIYLTELEIKENTETTCTASFLDLHLEFDSSGKLSTKIYEKRDDFDFKIINVPYGGFTLPILSTRPSPTSIFGHNFYLLMQQKSNFNCIWC